MKKRFFFVAGIISIMACGREPTAKPLYVYEDIENRSETVIFWESDKDGRLNRAVCSTIDPQHFNDPYSPFCSNRSSLAFETLDVAFENYRRDEYKQATSIMRSFDKRSVEIYAEAPEGKHLKKLNTYLHKLEDELEHLIDELQQNLTSVELLEREEEILTTQIKVLQLRLQKEPKNKLFRDTLQSSLRRLEEKTVLLEKTLERCEVLNLEKRTLETEAYQISAELKELRDARDHAIEQSKRKSNKYQAQIRRLELVDAMQAAEIRLKNLIRDGELLYRKADLNAAEQRLLRFYSETIRSSL